MLLLIGGMLLYAGRHSILRSLGEYLVDGDTDPRGEVAYILGGGRSTRVDYAVWLANRGQVDRFLVSRSPGLADVDGVKILPEHEIIVAMLRRLGVADDRIEVVEPTCRNTWGEAQALRGYLAKHDHVRVLVITSPHHTRRCRLLFDKVLGPEAVRVAFPVESFSDPDWYNRPSKRAAYGLEWMKIPSAWWVSAWPW
jgi:uncharacterized SAM-binding protein YcdF (DUF218 family)